MFHRRSPQGTLPRFIKSDRAFTLIELLATVAIIAVLLALLFSVLGKLKESSAGAACVSNLRQIGSVAAILALEKDGYTVQWEYSRDDATLGGTRPERANLMDFGMKRKGMSCPSQSEASLPGWVSSYSINLHMVYGPGASTGWGPDNSNPWLWVNEHGRYKRFQYSRPSEVMYFFDGCRKPGQAFSHRHVGFWDTPITDYIDFRHNGAANVLFLDGHVGQLRPEDISPADATFLRGFPGQP